MVGEEKMKSSYLFQLVNEILASPGYTVKYFLYYLGLSGDPVQRIETRGK